MYIICNFTGYFEITIKFPEAGNFFFKIYTIFRGGAGSEPHTWVHPNKKAMIYGSSENDYSPSNLTDAVLHSESRVSSNLDLSAVAITTHNK